MLFPDLQPVAAPPGVDLRCCDLFDLLAEVRGAQLVHADPPWCYEREAGGANPETAAAGFAVMSEAEITRALDLAYEEHSRKPVEWLRAMLRKWTEPGALVLDAWAGLAPLAGACVMEGRRYVGAEIDPQRHGHALALLRGVE